MRARRNETLRLEILRERPDGRGLPNKALPPSADESRAAAGERGRCAAQARARQGEAQLKMWTDNWDDLVEFEIVPVRTSDHAASVIGPQL